MRRPACFKRNSVCLRPLFFELSKPLVFRIRLCRQRMHTEMQFFKWGRGFQCFAVLRLQPLPDDQTTEGTVHQRILIVIDHPAQMLVLQRALK